MKYLIDIPNAHYAQLQHIKDTTGLSIKQQILTALDNYLHGREEVALHRSGGAVVSGVILFVAAGIRNT